MYRMVEREGVVRISPDMLSEDLTAATKELAADIFEGRMTDEKELVLLITDLELVGEGHIIHGDGGVYQKVRYTALVFRPELHEVVDGTVVEILKYGAFVRIGPLDGLLHISQIMDDHIDVDVTNERLTGRETKRDLRVNDRVRARLVAVTLNEKNPRESKIGLTMRQPCLGKHEWLEEERRQAASEESG
ncbi:MAG TPA: DNA-directed RNA polymerase [Thermoplasmata archaeon]|nr:DNA-directed RNA polymerase [Thermoplasmata archaeon]